MLHTCCFQDRHDKPAHTPAAEQDHMVLEVLCQATYLVLIRSDSSEMLAPANQTTDCFVPSDDQARQPHRTCDRNEAGLAYMPRNDLRFNGKGQYKQTEFPTLPQAHSRSCSDCRRPA